ncbi:hypothetical protein Gotur_024954 [Gossypium turneri]
MNNRLLLYLRMFRIHLTNFGGRCKTRGRTLLKYLYKLNSVERVKVARSSHG